MRFMSDFREAMWGVVQGVVSELDFDFGGYADQHFERLGRTAAEPAFRAPLGAEAWRGAEGAPPRESSYRRAPARAAS